MKSKIGFTLIEMLVVVLIIGILAAVALPQYQQAVDRSRFAALMEITKAIASANERYFMVHNQYTTKFKNLDINIQANSIKDSTAFFEWGKCKLNNQRQVYCFNDTNLQNEFTIFYYFSDHSLYRRKHLCMTLNDKANSRYDKLCQNIGVYLWTDTGCSEAVSHSCRVYQIK